MTSIFNSVAAYAQPQFWLSVLEIIWINILLSGDNAIVIALACRDLPRKQRLAGIVLGTALALALRLVFASVVSTLMLLPYVKIIGGLALLWIAIKLLVPDEDAGAAAKTPSDSLWRAVKLIAAADVIMSLDNVIAVAGAANGNYALLIFGLGISVPTVVAGAAILMAILEYFPLIIWAGAALLGWIAGDVIATDPALTENSGTLGEVALERIRVGLSVLGACGTVVGGFLWRRARKARRA
jgi:YjbE family integral membrane protein